ncbi:MAG: helix-turn-helix domain-containing protein [SAR324 cluster bacterium]|nr:helix-turn-helix domain-containing protein [SAR324 cluster bacterium]
MRQHTHRQERAQPLRKLAVPVPHLRGEQSAASQATYSEERKAEVLRAYQERSSLRGLSRTFGITRKTITQWLKKNS